MRYFLLIFIFIICALIGYQIKNKFRQQLIVLRILDEFINYLYLNISIYKINLTEIINNYLIQQNNINAKLCEIFKKNAILSRFDIENINKQIYDPDIKISVNDFILNLGKNELINECEKIKSFKLLLKEYINKTNQELKEKGDLYFKICLAIGLVIVILLW